MSREADRASSSCWPWQFRALGLLVAFLAGLVPRGLPPADAAEPPKSEYQIHVDSGHPWRPPFGLERVGRPLTAVVEISTDRPPSSEYLLVAASHGKEIARSVLNLSGDPPYRCPVSFDIWPTELVLWLKSETGERELVRQPLAPPALEAEAVARPDRVLNPVDLGTILVPSDWLLLAGGQQGTVDFAAIARREDLPLARVTAWFESVPSAKTMADLALPINRRVQRGLPLPPAPATLDRDVLHVSLTAGGVEHWHKTIPTMVVHQTSHWPKFGAVATKLRYDAPISVLGADGSYASLPYTSGWDTRLNDVVVALPNGSRFVFWRGSSYIPFWAGQQNTGLCYEWAERRPSADGTDCIEPLMDKELRYGRVEIVESTAARVHVRWTYQSCDFHYKVWGDSAVEDYYFYPDGFGTRVLTLQRVPGSVYELSELIVLTPQSTYPWEVLPSNLLDILFVDGQKRELRFPCRKQDQGDLLVSRDLPAVYRVRMHKDEPMAAIYFNPRDAKLPQHPYRPFFDQGEMVTPVYWGSHWPLARGRMTGGAIDDRISLTPCHNSILTWGMGHYPVPVRSGQVETLDALGRSRSMTVETWVWLIGMTDADDGRLLQWAGSFSQPPSIELQGAHLDAEPYTSQRRAIRLCVDAPEVTITVKPAAVTVNPVFELSSAPKHLLAVELAGRRLEPSQWAWDGATLWIDATLTEETAVRLRFGDSSTLTAH